MAIGVRNSYATTEAPQDNILQSMQYVDQLDYRAKQDRALEAEAKAKAEEEKQKAFTADLEKIKTLPTGNRGYDAPVIEATTKLATKYADYKRMADSGKISPTEFAIKRNQILSQVDLLKEKSKLIIDKYKTIDELIKTDKLEDGFEDGALSLGKAIDNGQIYGDLDENDNVVFTAYSEDDNGNKSIIEKNNIADFGNARLNPTMKVNFQNEIEQFKKNNALGLQESISSNIKTGVKELKKGSNIDKNIRAFAEARVQDPNFLRIAYRNATGETKYDITDPSEIKKAEDWVYDQIYNSYSKEVNKDEAYQGANFGLAVRKQNFEEAEAKEDEPSFNVVEPSPEYARKGIVPAKGYKAVSITGPQKPINSVRGFRDGKQVTVSNPILNSYTVVKTKGGERRIAAEITYPDVKSSTLSPNEKKAYDLVTLEPEKATEEQKMIVQKITKGVENKTDVFYMTESEFVKFKGTVKAKNASEMADKAKVSEEDEYDEFGVKIK